MATICPRGGLVHRVSVLSDRILFIDAEAIVIDKPAGLPVDAPRRGGDSIASRLDELRCGFRRPPTPMHRLDTDTSGCLLFARTPKARASFQQAFEARAVEKYYLAVVASDDRGGERGRSTCRSPRHRAPRPAGGWSRDPAGPGGDQRAGGGIAVRDGSTLVEFRPVTGRTHQIRVHAREAFGSGIVGDRVYGIPGGPMLLHASRLVVPRDGKAGDRRDRAAARLFRRVARCGLRTSYIPEDALSESFLAATGPGRAERQQGRDRGPAARRRVPARPAPGRLRAAEDDRREPHDRRRRAADHRAPLPHPGRQPRRCAAPAGGNDRRCPYRAAQAQGDAAERGPPRRSGSTTSGSAARSSRRAER